MDLAVYISELLGLEGEVSLPGIGHFTQVRVNGYYNEAESKFYPPAHEVKFEPQSKDDNGLARYISDKKNISLASAKYFIDKYVIGLKQQLASRTVEISGIGFIYTNGSVMEFNADNVSNSNDPSFFGLQPIEVTPLDHDQAKIEMHDEEIPVHEVFTESDEPVSIQDEPITELENDSLIPQDTVETIVQPELASEEPPEEQLQELAYEEPVRTGNRNGWVAILLIVIIALLALLGLYKYKAEWFEGPKNNAPAFVAVNADSAKRVTDSTKQVIATDTLKTDTVNTAARHDTVAAVATPKQTISAPIDTFANVHYDILGGAFKTLPEANKIINRYKRLGLHPRLLNHINRHYYRVTLGTYFSKEEAQKAQDSILTSTKIHKTDIYLQPYLPKK